MHSHNNPARPSESGIFSDPHRKANDGGVHFRASAGAGEEKEIPGLAKAKVSGNISLEVHKPQKPSCAIL